MALTGDSFLGRAHRVDGPDEPHEALARAHGTKAPLEHGGAARPGAAEGRLPASGRVNWRPPQQRRSSTQSARANGGPGKGGGGCARPRGREAHRPAALAAKLLHCCALAPWKSRPPWRGLPLGPYKHVRSTLSFRDTLGQVSHSLVPTVCRTTRLRSRAARAWRQPANAWLACARSAGARGAPARALTATRQHAPAAAFWPGLGAAPGQARAGRRLDAGAAVSHVAKHRSRAAGAERRV